MKAWIILLIITIATAVFVFIKTSSDDSYFADYGKIIYWAVWLLGNIVMWIVYFLIKKFL